MRERFIRVVKRASKKITTLAAVTVMAFSGLAAAAPMFMNQTAYAATTISVCSSGCDYTTVQDAVSNAQPGDTVTLEDGTYTLATTLYINKPLTLTGFSESGTIIDATGVAAGYGVSTAMDGVTIENLTINGPTNSTGYGLKIEGSSLGSLAADSNINVSNVTVNGSYRSGIDLNGVNNVTLTNVASTGVAHGNGVAITDSHNVTINGVSVNNDAWGGIALYASGTYYACGVDHFILEGTNDFGKEILPLYTGVDNLSNPACTITNLSIPDLPYKVTLSAGDPADAYFTNLTNAGLIAGSTLAVRDSSDNTQVWVAPNQTIQNEIDVAHSGDTVNVPAGHYDGFSLVSKSNISVVGAGVSSTYISPTTLVDSGTTHKYTSDMKVSIFVDNSSGITIQGLTVKDNGLAPGLGGPDALVFWNASSGSIKDTNITAAYTINGQQTGQGIALDGHSGTVGLNLSNVNISGFQKNGIDVIDGNGAGGSATDTTTLTVNGGSITGAGTTGAIAQNGIVLWDRGGGSVSATVNGTSISGFKYGALDIPNGDYATGILTYGNSSSVTVSNSSLTNSDYSVFNATTSGTAHANGNWWGNALGPQTSQYSDSVTVSSWCSVSDCSVTQTASSGTTSLPSGPISTPTVSGSTSSVTIPSTNSVVATTTTSSGTVQITIPAGTTVTADNTAWDGTISAPTVTSVSLGSSKNVSLAIEVGAGNTSLTFDNAVRLVLPGQAGKSVGFVRNGNFTTITDVCSTDSQSAGNALAAGGDCHISVGNDMVVWTKHFTTFVAYSNATSPSGGGSSTSSSSTSGTTSSSASSGTGGSNNGVVQGESTTNGQTSSTNTEVPATASLAQPKIAAKEAAGGGLRWYWIVLIAIFVLGLAVATIYRYAEGTDKA